MTKSYPLSYAKNQKFLATVSYRHPGKPLILKSPPHTARVAVLARLFPNARFVHIVRDPITVFGSIVHLWKTLHAVSGLVPASDSAIESFVLDSMKDMYANFDNDVAKLPANCLYQIRYEDLIAEPLTTLDGCYRALDLGDFAVVRARVEEYLRKLRGYRIN